MAARFFVAEGLAPAMVGSIVQLPESVAHHAARVVRLAAGDALTLFDGNGGEYAAVLAGVDRRAVSARIERFDPVERESALHVTLVQAVVANDAMDYAVRKAVELGVAAIVPMIAARSAPLPAGERMDKRVAHWRQIAIAACEQCGRNRVPAVATPQALAQWQPPSNTIAYVAGPDAGTSLGAVARPAGACAILIGPEGGFAGQELEALRKRGVVEVSLGPRILRTETAAVAALAIMQARWGDLATAR